MVTLFGSMLVTGQYVCLPPEELHSIVLRPCARAVPGRATASAMAATVDNMTNDLGMDAFSPDDGRVDTTYSEGILCWKQVHQMMGPDALHQRNISVPAAADTIFHRLT
jgi:hypothetical protein